MSLLFQIVFKGELIDGFDPAAVRASAARRLKAAPEQIDRVFSGTRAILKKGLTEELAQRYLTELQRIGMLVFVEPENIKVSRPALPETTEPIVPTSTVSARPAPKSEPQRVTSRDQAPAFDPAKTQIASMQEDSPSPQRWSQPTIAISQRHLNEIQTNNAMQARADYGVEPTLIVPPRNNAASEPTIVVTRGSASSQPTMVVPPRHSSSSEPTMVVPPRHSLASDPTLIVPPRRNAAAEPTMIVPPRQSTHAASSEPTMIVPPRHTPSSDATIVVAPRQSAASQPTIIVRSNQKLPPTVSAGKPADASFDPEKTLIAASENIDDYLSPTSDEERSKAVPAPAHRATPEATPVPEVQCPTCGDKQPKRVYCRRCGHALSLPAKSVAPELLAPQFVAETHDTGEETVLYEAPAEPTSAGVTRRGFFAWRAWLAIGLIFAVLLGIAAWLLM